MTDRKVFYIDVGKMSKAEAAKVIERIMKELKR